MKEYNLDEKTGLFGMFASKGASKLINKGDKVSFMHYSSFEAISSEAVTVSDSIISIRTNTILTEGKINLDEPVVISFSSSGDTYSLCGNISAIDSLNPVELKIKIAKIEKFKDLKKSERFYVSLLAAVKVIGVPENVFAVVKAISLGGAKFNCNEDIMMEDLVDIIITIDKSTKLTFKGRIVRKNTINNGFEYGVSVFEASETNFKILAHLIGKLEFGT